MKKFFALLVISSFILTGCKEKTEEEKAKEKLEELEERINKSLDK